MRDLQHDRGDETSKTNQPRQMAGAALAGNISFYLLIATLAWTPFLLGSDRPWSWTLLTFLVLACWLLWLISRWGNPEGLTTSLRRVAGPVILAVGALLWGLVQICSRVPAAWIHPVWGMAADGLNRPVSGMISLNGWDTVTELMKLVTYMMAGWLAYSFCQRPERAKQMLNAIITIGALYASYALVMAMLGLRQGQIFYSVPLDGSPVAAPFVSHAGFASFTGMSLICACAKFVVLSRGNIVSVHGPRTLFLTTLKFIFGRGTTLLLATLVLFSMLIASASRAGFLAALIGLMTVLTFAMVMNRRQAINRWTAIAIVAIALCALTLFQLNGAALKNNLSELTPGDNALLGLRNVFWSAAVHMIWDAPQLGIGLGGFEHAYPLYADHVYPYNIDKAHNDHLELAVGWGLPAAIAWWGALLWLAVKSARGVLTRRRDQIYPLIAVGATVLVAVHSIFDFTLQLPAVALIYVLILGCGVAQSFSSRS